MAKITAFRQKKKKRSTRGFWKLAGFGLAAGIVIGLALPYLPPLPSLPQTMEQMPSERGSAQFGLCFTGGGTNCVVDGDTIWLDGQKIRVADIDAPETHPPRCALESDLGTRATHRLQELVNAGPFAVTAVDRDTDKYGRKLRVLTRGGQSLGDVLVSEGLARTWTGKREPWC